MEFGIVNRGGVARSSLCSVLKMPGRPPDLSEKLLWRSRLVILRLLLLLRLFRSGWGRGRGMLLWRLVGGWKDLITGELAWFIGERDTFFIATANLEQPYIQHRGGPVGFLKVVDERTLGFADYSGNRQYITVGNLDDNAKAFIFLMDFAGRRRIKIWGRAEVVENDDAALLKKLRDPGYDGDVERMFLFHIDAWDANCPKHIKPRFTEEEVGDSVQGLRDRIAELEERVRGF